MAPLRKYLWAAGAACLGVVAVLGFNALFLWRTGEHLGLRAIVDEQIESGGLYNGLVAYLDYKEAVYKRRAPQIVALGSSIPLHIRDYAFKVPFYNLGGSVRSQPEAFMVTDRFFRIHRPSTVLYVLDFWHFCTPNIEGIVRRPAPRGDFGHRPIPLLTSPSQIVVNGTITLDEYARTVVGHYDRFSPLTRSGFTAVIEHLGFSPDGSRYYNLHGNLLPVEDRQRHWLEFFHRETDIFRTDCHFAAKQVDLLLEFIREMAAQGTRVVTIPAIVPPTIVDALAASGKFSYIETWRRRMAAQFPYTWDVFDARVLGATDCEFNDYIHGGEIVYLRALRALSRKPDDPLWGLVDDELVDQLVAQHRNGVTAAHNQVGDAYRQKIEQQQQACRE